MGCNSNLHHVPVLVAVAGGCIALVGWAAVLTWRAESTQLVKDVIRDRQTENKVERRKRWRGLVLSLLPFFLLLGLISLIHLPKTAYVMWVGTFVPIGAVDMAHWEHCKAIVTDKPVDPEIQTLNRLAQRAGPILVPVGVASPSPTRPAVGC
jgi:hypothetical protein